MKNDAGTKAEQEDYEEKILVMLRLLRSLSKKRLTGNDGSLEYKGDKVRSATIFLTVECKECHKTHSVEISMNRDAEDTVQCFHAMLENMGELMSKAQKIDFNKEENHDGKKLN
jgi:hypothetical protein